MNYILNSVIITLLVAEALNLLVRMYNKTLRLDQLFREGGMPSRHAALVTSLCVALYITEGVSTAFTVSVVLALIVLRDAIGIRHNLDRTVAKLNTLLPKADFLRFVSGHTLLQVIGGIVVGMLIPYLLHIY